MSLCQLGAIILSLLISVELLLIYLNRDTLAVLFPRHNPVKELRKLYEKRKKERAKKHKEFADILNKKVNDNKQ